MVQILTIYSRLRYFIFLLLLFAVAGGVVIATVPKGNLELWVNNHHTPFADTFFYYVTAIGNGWFYFAVVISLLLSTRRNFLICAVTGIMCSVVTSTLKYLVFTGTPRPATFFKDTVTLHFVEGIPILYSGSFPSGHSISVFALFCFLSFMFRRRSLQFIFFLIALLAIFSRVYLLAHFKEDIYAGAIIGSLTAMLVVFAAEKFFPEKHQNEIVG